VTDRPRLVLLRHAESTYNAEHRLNGDPAVPVGLTDLGRLQALAARRSLAPSAFDVGVHTRFPRTAETLGIVLDGRAVPVVECADLDDVDVGEFEGGPVMAYRAWRAAHGPGEAPPAGESRIAALARYVRGYERILSLDARNVLAVIHDVPIRFLVNAVHGADPIGGPHQTIPNATPLALPRGRIEEGLERMRHRVAAEGAGP
jgi:broad specificity phosphatase PhoE